MFVYEKKLEYPINIKQTNPKLAKIAELKEKLAPLVAEYERKFGPLRKCANDENKWLWYKNPWPWDNEEDM